MRYFEILNENPDERLQRAKEQGFDIDDPHYHGTPYGDFDEFDPYETADEDLAYGKGVYTTRDPEAASGYSRPGSSWGNKHAEDAQSTVYKVYLKVKNPFDLDKIYPYTEVKRIMEHCFTPRELESIEFWTDIQTEAVYSSKYYDQIQELEEHLVNLDYTMEGLPDPDDYDDGEKDEEYIKDRDDAIEYEEKSIKRQIEMLQKRENTEELYHKKALEAGKIANAFGRDIYRTLWTNTTGYHDWKSESQLFGGETETIEYKTEANQWLEELGYDGIRHTDHYNPGASEKRKAHIVTIAFHPNQVRSAHANFHPDKIDSAKMSESINEDFAQDARTNPDRAFFGNRVFDISPKIKSNAAGAGFDTSKVWYHGSNNKIVKRFRKSPGTGIDELGSGIYFADTVRIAYHWALDDGYIICAYLRAGDYLDLQKVKSKEKHTILDLYKRHCKMMIAKWGKGNEYKPKQFMKLLIEGYVSFDKLGYIGAYDHTSQIPGQIIVYSPDDIKIVKIISGSEIKD